LPARYFKVETPLPAVEEMLGCSGYVDHVIAQTEARQQANRIGYPSAYWQVSATAWTSRDIVARSHPPVRMVR
jgi:hypothetical protein